jgi:hypothetical protein
MAKAEVVLSAADQTKAAFDSAKRNLKGLGDQAQALPAKFGTLGVAIAGVFSAATIKGAVDVLDRLDDLSEKSGVSVENLSALRYAGEVTGTTFESLAGGITKLNKNMAEAAGGGKEAAAAFKAVGVEVTNGVGGLRSQDEILGELADQFATYEDGAAKAALAQKIFGKSGEEMIPLLNLGSEGIARLRKEAASLGAVYGAEVAKQAAEFNDNLKKLELNAEATKVSIAGGLLPTLNELLETFLKLKSTGQVWTVIEEGIRRVVSLVPGLSALQMAAEKLGLVRGPSLTANPGQDINKLLGERTELQSKQRDLEAFASRVESQRFVSQLDRRLAANKRGESESIQRDIFKIDDLLEVSRIRQATDALRDTGDTTDALSRRRRLATAKTQAPVVSDGSGAAAANKELKEQAKLVLELAGLTGTFTEDWNRLNTMYAKGTINLKTLTEEQAKLLSLQPAMKAQLELEQKIGEARTKNAEITQKHLEALANDNEQIVKSNQALREQVEEIGLSAEALNLLRMARLDANIAREEELLLVAQGVEGNEAEVAQLERKINLMRQERLLKGDAAQKEIIANEAEDAKRRTQTISESISEGVLDGFRNSKSFSDVFLDELKAQWSKAILQPVISPIVQMGQDAMSGALKGLGGGSTVADLFGLAGNLFGGGATDFGAGDFARMDRLMSFDGGGSTGPGLRAGGLDGKGGFMAILHPDETVTDHTKGQKVGGTVINNYSFGAGVSRAEAYEGYRRARAEAVGDVVEGNRRRRF